MTIEPMTDDHRRLTASLSPQLTEAVLEALTHGVMITAPNLEIIAVNSAFTQVTGYRREEVVGKTPKLLKSGRHGREFYRKMWRAIEGCGRWEGEIWNRRRSGEAYLEWLSISSIKDGEGRVTHYVGVFSDITRRKQWETELEQLSFHDGLTGLPNRLLHRDRLEQAMARARRHDQKVALLYLDLDGFKEVNDTLGHASGDLLLREAARRLVSCLRKLDTVARLGGDEFSVVLPEVAGAERALLVARKILDRLGEPFHLEGARRFVTVSIGIALFPDHAVNADSLIENADRAMYAAKRQGRNGIEVYAPPPPLGETARPRIKSSSLER